MPRIDEQAVKNAFAECACMSPDCCDLYITAAMDLTKRMIKDELADIQIRDVRLENLCAAIALLKWKKAQYRWDAECSDVSDYYGTDIDYALMLVKEYVSLCKGVLKNGCYEDFILV